MSKTETTHERSPHGMEYAQSAARARMTLLDGWMPAFDAASLGN